MEDSKDDLKELSDEEVLKKKEKKSKESEQSLNPSNYESSLASLSFKPYDNYIPITERFLARTLQGFSKVLYAQVAKDNWEKHEEAAASYAELK
ncbi:hypothetical protein Tco_0800088 [Tanacetum coccineum]|uniref:Uncharacterized protein n=1 Tax=Tanacetum coccineum TaxID=301880 RepID=A0ABQ4ZS52_9ASTR